MSYEELKQFCRESWEEEYIYLCIDISQEREIRENILFVMKAKTHILNVPRKDKFFQ